MSTDREEVVQVLLEALEAIVHQLLFVRQLYPAELFERQQLYGVAVRRSRHPELNSYIAEVVGSLKGPLANGTLAKLVLVVLDASRAPVERHIVQPKVLAPAQSAGAAALDVEALQAQLRGVVLKLQYADAYLARLPPGCTFELLAYTTDRRGVSAETWVEEQPGPGVLELRDAEIVPIKSCRVEGAFQLQFYAESQPRQATQ